MGGGDRRGGRVELLPLIREHEEAVELDLFDRGVDYRDRWRPGGGESRLTLRRLLLLIVGMDPFESRFWMACGRLDLWEQFNEDITPEHYAPTAERLLSDVIAMFAEKPHPWRTWRSDLRVQREREEKRARILAGIERRKEIAAEKAARERALASLQPPSLLDLNTVAPGALAERAGVPAWVAELVVEHRDAHGAFQAVEDVRHIKGIGPKRYAAIAAVVEV